MQMKPHSARWGSLSLYASGYLYAALPVIDMPRLEEAILVAHLPLGKGPACADA